ncbi:hypothetical protein BN1708_002276 [Verticillium longisporum]|uniref:Rhodopsin domain-containing protein n=1 Tax=Verticillium longisporum TaxID=100787 RepID=A0A0G4KLI1_VERLO|nr:hypothetical protein BN1708_002276 [Verticillium longisporum]
MDESNDIMVSGDPTAMSTPNRTTSAFSGQPPNTVRDANIVQGTFWVDFKLDTLDPSGGIPFAPVPPPGYEHEDKQAAIIVGMVLVILAITVPTMARIVARFRSTEMRLGLDDYTIVLAASLATVYPCFQIWMVVSAGGGRHSWENTYEDWEEFVRGLSSCRLLFFVTVGLIKISITLFVRRLADRASVFWRLAADVFLGSLVLYVLAALFWNSLFCMPPRAWFSRQYAGSLARPPRCSSDVTNARVFSITHTVQSFLLLGAPIIIMWHVQIDANKKRRLFAIWICGAVTVLGGVLQQIAFVITNDLLTTPTSWAPGTRPPAPSAARPASAAGAGLARAAATPRASACRRWCRRARSRVTRIRRRTYSSGTEGAMMRVISCLMSSLQMGAVCKSVR